MRRRAFIWRSYRHWKPHFLKLLNDVLTPEVIQAVVGNPPQYLVGDATDWLDEAARSIGSIDESSGIRDILDSRFTQAYPFVRAFHGCKPLSVESYQRFGLRGSDVDALKEEALRLFGDNSRTRAAIADLEERTSSQSYADYNRGKVFFCFDMRHLLQDCGHYVIYGSEYLQSVANRLGAIHILRERGTATVIDCDVPYEAMLPSCRHGLCGDILCAIFQELIEPEELGRPLRGGFPVHENIPPRNIVRFYYPKRISDPHNRMMEYVQRA